MGFETIPGIGGSRAKDLRNAGYDDIEDLAEADPEDLPLPEGTAESAIQYAHQQSINTKTAADLLGEYEEIGYISTGVDGLDEELGGGWEDETLGMVYGKSGRGKTQLAFSSLVEAAAEGTAIYIQTENQSKSIAERIHTMAGSMEPLENIVFYEVYDVQEQFEVYKKIQAEYDPGDLSLIVVDSLTAQFRVAEEFEGRNNLGDRSTVLGRHLKELALIARTYSIPIAMTGQVYPSPEAYGKGDNLWGGEKMRHFISYFVRMSSGQGELLEAELQNHPGRDGEVVLVNVTDDGINTR